MGDVLALGAPGPLRRLQARPLQDDVIQHERSALFTGESALPPLQGLQGGMEMLGIELDGKFTDLQAQTAAGLADVQIPQIDASGQQGGLHLPRDGRRLALAGKDVRQAVQQGLLHALFRLVQEAVGHQTEQCRQDEQGKKKFFHGRKERGGSGRPSVDQSMR